jgi:hypothetical protein
MNWFQRGNEKAENKQNVTNIPRHILAQFISERMPEGFRMLLQELVDFLQQHADIQTLME